MESPAGQFCISQSTAAIHIMWNPSNMIDLDRAFKTEIKPTLMALVIEWASVKHGDLTTGTDMYLA